MAQELNKLIGDVRRGPAGVSKQPTLGLLVRLASIRDKLPTALQAVADLILEKPETIVRQSVTEVAEAASVSEGTVVRLCKQLGVKGFQDLKTSLAYEMIEPVRLIHEDVQAGDDVLTVAKKVFHSDIQALEATIKVFDPAAMQMAVDIILNARRVELYGVGSSGPIAVDAYYRLLRMGINCAVTTDSHMQVVNAALTNANVAVITISHSGSTIETVGATRLAKEAGAKTICVTNYGKSPIQAYADVLLYTVSTETLFRTEAMASRIGQLSLIDTLCVNVALANLDQTLVSLARSSDALSLRRF